MQRWFLALVVTSACRFAPVPATGDDGGPRDGTTDAMHDAQVGSEPGAICFGSSAIDMVCPSTIATSPLTITTATSIDTDSASCTDTTANAIPVCVIQGTSITIMDHTTVTVHGSRPLVLVATGATGTIMFMGGNSVLDVGSHLGGTIGPAALPDSKCTVGAVAASGKGGGAGGSNAGAGGAGGADNNNSGAGTPSTPFSTPTTLHGGCGGATGIGATLTSLGSGGGAVALIAPTIHIDGIVTASGSGGSGAPAIGGGAGGGAGGMIVLDAPTIAGGGSILAQGGGGGEGSAGAGGRDGSDGFVAGMPGSDTKGGSGGSPDGGDGGDGASTTQTTGAAGDGGTIAGAGAGGGGGGGGPGFNLVLGGVPAMMLTFSPTHS